MKNNRKTSPLLLSALRNLSAFAIYDLSDTEILNFGRVAAAMSLAAADATSGVIDIKESEKRCECFERK